MDQLQGWDGLGVWQGPVYNNRPFYIATFLLLLKGACLTGGGLGAEKGLRYFSQGFLRKKFYLIRFSSGAMRPFLLALRAARVSKGWF